MMTARSNGQIDPTRQLLVCAISVGLGVGLGMPTFYDNALDPGDVVTASLASVVIFLLLCLVHRPKSAGIGVVRSTLHGVVSGFLGGVSCAWASELDAIRSQGEAAVPLLLAIASLGPGLVAWGLVTTLAGIGTMRLGASAGSRES